MTRNDERQTRRRPASYLVACAAALFLATTPTVQANGGSFFEPVVGDAELAYFGRVKDARTGRPLPQFPYIAVLERPSSTYIQFDGDAPGHFLSPDIGALVRQATGKPVDPRQLEIYVFAEGYETVTISRAPRKATGRVEIDVRMVPKVGEGALPASDANTTSPGSGTRTPWMIAIAGLAVVALACAWRVRRATVQT